MDRPPRIALHLVPSVAEPSTTQPITMKLSAARTGIMHGLAPPPGIASRIQRIRALLDRGEYLVDLDTLAARIVDDEILRSKPGVL